MRFGGSKDSTSTDSVSTNDPDAPLGLDLADRAEALDRAADIARGRLSPEVVDNARLASEHVRARLRHSTDRTVVAIAGPTGAGKSSLFNALVGSDVSTPGVRRPTTAVAHAALWGGDDPRLLRWLEVQRRFLVDDTSGDNTVAEPGALDGLVLLDLPDVDSIEVPNRLEAQRLIDMVDMMIWVLDPQKYADEVVHNHIRALSSHAEVLRFIVTKIDQVPTAERGALANDLATRLNEDGVASPIIWPVSLATPVEGVDAVRGALADVVRHKNALVDRLNAELRQAAQPMIDAGGGTRGNDPLPEALAEAAADEVAAAAHVDTVADAFGTQYRRDARRATGWPPLELIRSRRPSAIGQVTRADSVDRLRVENALRTAAEKAAVNVDEPWASIVRREAMSHADDVATSLRTTALSVERSRREPRRWWSALGWLQKALIAVAIVGAAWLVGVAIAGGLGLSTEPLLPKVGRVIVPNLMLIGGVLAGLLLAVVASLLARVGARRQAAKARRELVAGVKKVIRAEVTGPVEAVLADRAELQQLARIAAGAAG